MKKSNKIYSKLLSIALVCVMLVTSMGAKNIENTTYAGENDHSYVSASGGAREATESQKNDAKNENKYYNDAVNYSEPFDWTPLKTLFYMDYYAQETSMSCGPASVRMILGYLTGTNYSEKTIRDNTKYSIYVGTYLVDLLIYVKKQKTRNNYVSAYDNNYSDMCSKLYNGIANYDAPPIIGIKGNENQGWEYDFSNGHYVV